MSTQPIPEVAPEVTIVTLRGIHGSEKRSGKRSLWMVWPSVILLILVIGVPFVVAIYISFLHLDQDTLRNWVDAPWVGLNNYVRAFTSGSVVGSSMLASLGISVSFSLVTTLLVTPIGILAALTVNTPYRGRTFVRSLYLIPYVLPTFATALVWRMMFLNKTGLIDEFLAWSRLGSGETYWLLGPNSFWAMVIADVWASWAFVYIMVLAGLQTISPDIYDAAEVDGANAWQKLMSIVLPHLRSILGLALLLSTINHFNNFTLPFVMFGTPPPVQADVLPLNIYISSFQLFDFGLGGTMSLITLLIMLIPGIIYVRTLRLGEVVTS
jgi:multiple sugar transport system permease protein